MFKSDSFFSQIFSAKFPVPPRGVPVPGYFFVFAQKEQPNTNTLISNHLFLTSAMKWKTKKNRFFRQWTEPECSVVKARCCSTMPAPPHRTNKIIYILFIDNISSNDGVLRFIHHRNILSFKNLKPKDFKNYFFLLPSFRQ